MSDIQEKILELMDLFDEDEVTTADKINRPEPKQSVKEIELFNEFNIRNPLAGGGMLVQPSADGRRPGYSESREIKQKREGRFTNVYKNAQGDYVYKSGSGNNRIYKSGFKTPEAASKWGQKEFVKKFALPKKFVSASELSNILGFGSGKGSGMQSPLFERGDRPRYLLQEARKILGSYQAGGSNFFKLPTKKEIEYLKKYSTAPLIQENLAKNVQIILDSKAIMNDLTGKNKSGAKLPKFNKVVQVFKNAGVNASDAQITNALQKAAYLLRGDTFQTNVKYNIDKATGNFIIKEIEKLPFDNQYTRGIYKHALQEINKELGNTAGNLDSFKRNFKKRLPKNFLEKHNLNVNEIFSVRASVKNKSYPYAYFIDVIDADLNQKSLRSFHGALSKAQTNLNSKIKDVRAGKAKYDDLVKIVEKFNETRDKYKETIKINYPNKPFNLPNIVLGKESEILKSNMKIPGDIYSKKLLDKWQNEGLDITGHAKKTGYVMTGAANKGVFTAQDLSRNPEIRKQAISDIRNKVLELASTVTDRCPIGNADGGRIGYSLGSEACFKIGKQALNNGIKNGFQKGSQQALLATQIINAGKGLKNMASISGLLGPQATLLFAATEAGLIGADMLTKGKTLKEAVADSLINPALGPKLKQDSKKLFVERLKNLGVSDQEIGKGLMFDRMVEDVNTLDDLKQRKFIADQKVEQSKELYPAAVDKEEREIPGVGGFKFDKPFLSIPDVRDKRKKEASDIAMDIQDIYRTADRNVLDLFEGKFEKPETQEIFEQAAAQKQALEGLVAADQARAVAKNIYGKFIQGPRSREKMNELISRYFDMGLEDTNPAFNIPGARDATFVPGKTVGGLYGFAGGGIAKIAGVDQGPPPESGPNSQGLKGLFNRVKRT